MSHLLCCEGFAVYEYSVILRAAHLRHPGLITDSGLLQMSRRRNPFPPVLLDEDEAFSIESSVQDSAFSVLKIAAAVPQFCRSLLAAPVFHRRHAGKAVEHPAEIIFIRHTGQMGDFLG